MKEILSFTVESSFIKLFICIIVIIIIVNYIIVYLAHIYSTFYFFPKSGQNLRDNNERSLKNQKVKGNVILFKYTCLYISIRTRTCMYIQRENIVDLMTNEALYLDLFYTPVTFELNLDQSVNSASCKQSFCNGMGMLIILIRMPFSNQFKTKNIALLSAGEQS